MKALLPAQPFHAIYLIAQLSIEKTHRGYKVDDKLGRVNVPFYGTAMPICQKVVRGFQTALEGQEEKPAISQ